MTALLQADNLGKAYRQYRSEWQRIGRWFGIAAQPRQEQWVLRHLSFTMERGESIGIVGPNGAGKSTLLKLITGTLQATEGSLRIGGRIAAILELGMGFSPELSGRQNAAHALGLMGLAPAVIARSMAGVEAFADIGSYFDQPVRTYSSGMQARLSFAVATVDRPDILIVDEALSVGDIHFQQKCFERIRHFQAEGMALLFVSHSAGAIYSLCGRALLLLDGRLVADGEPREIMDRYNATMDRPREDGHGIADDPVEEAVEEMTIAAVEQSGAEGSFAHPAVAFQSVGLIQGGKPATLVSSAQPANIRIVLRFAEALADPHVGFRIHDARGEPAFMTNTHCMGSTIGPVAAGSVVAVDYRLEMNLAPGEYTVTVGVARDAVGEGSFAETLARLTHVATFTLVDDNRELIWSGRSNLRPLLTVQRLHA